MSLSRLSSVAVRRASLPTLRLSTLLSRRVSSHLISAGARYRPLATFGLSASVSRTHGLFRTPLRESGRRNFSSSKLPKEGYSMNKLSKIAPKIALCLLVGGVLISSNLGASETQPAQKKSSSDSSLPALLNTKFLETIRHSNEVPGLNVEEFSTLKSEIIKNWNTLFKEGVLKITGTDQEARPYLVTIQGVFEHVLASALPQHVKMLKGVIHTPMPATPLCSKGEISKELVDPSIASDPARLFTVKARTTLVRDYLFKGGDLYVVYPKSGYQKRTEEQRMTYEKELKNYPTHLFDLPLNCETIPNEVIGATYLFEDEGGNKFVFAIKMTQAKDPQERGEFGLWFGPLTHRAIQERLQTVSGYLEQNNVTILKQ